MYILFLGNAYQLVFLVHAPALLSIYVIQDKGILTTPPRTI